MKKLEELLFDENHSGMIEGLCRITIPEEFSDIAGWIKGGQENRPLQATFSFGTEALGKYPITCIGPVHVDKEAIFEISIGEKSITVEINTVEVVGGCSVYRFKAVAYV